MLRGPGGCIWVKIMYPWCLVRDRGRLLSLAGERAALMALLMAPTLVFGGLVGWCVTREAISDFLSIEICLIEPM